MFKKFLFVLYFEIFNVYYFRLTSDSLSIPTTMSQDAEDGPELFFFGNKYTTRTPMNQVKTLFVRKFVILTLIYLNFKKISLQKNVSGL